MGRMMGGEYPGTAEPTDETVVEVTFSSLERGTLTRYLGPGESIDLPADRVEVRCFPLDEDDAEPAEDEDEDEEPAEDGGTIAWPQYSCPECGAEAWLPGFDDATTVPGEGEYRAVAHCGVCEFVAISRRDD